MFFKQSNVKDTVVHPHHELLLRKRKNRPLIYTHNNLEESPEDDAELKKPTKTLYEL